MAQLPPGISFPTPWYIIMQRGRFTANDSDVIKEIIDVQLDTMMGSIPGEFLRKEMEMQKTVFPTCDVYELWFWTFEENSLNLLAILCEAVVERAKPAADVRIIARAVALKKDMGLVMPLGE